MDHNLLYHRVAIDREMYMKCLLETIVTSFLLLSRVWARPSDVICDGGRGEGDKWFDGCRWCVCQRSGPMCSSSECSPLASRVLPCHKVDSRWYDGCYHCKCYRHGIECTANESCRLLMRTERFYTDFLSRGACVNPKDDRCVCGIDGVPSCTAEVIDRNAFPVTTIGLNPVFPASSSLVIPKVVYYQRPFFKSYEKVRGKMPTPELYSDSSYINYNSDHRAKRTIKQHRRRHSLFKRQTKKTRHSPVFYDGRDKLPEWRTRIKEPALEEPALEEPALEELSFAGSDLTKIGVRLYNKIKHRGCSGVSNFICRYERSSDEIDSVVRDRENYWPGHAKRDTPKRSGLDGLYESGQFRESSEVNDGEMLDDEPGDTNQINIDSSSLFIASGNRCRWGVRWYGGSLRCYCDVDNSITCGDPSFVALRIDGFRLESAPCEEGHVWEDDNSCRECECRINGVILCRRSPSCPLPFLIKPLPMDLEDDSSPDRKELLAAEKSPNSEEQTDEFTGQTEHKIDWDKPNINPNTNPTSSEENMSNEKDDKDITLTKQSSAKDSPDEAMHENTAPPFTVSGDTDQIVPTSSETYLDIPDLGPNVSSLNLIADSTSPPAINKYNTAEYETEDSNEENDNSNAQNVITIIDSGTDLDETDSGQGQNNNNFKRTTQVIVGECKPSSLWLDGCKRCKCDKDGRKLCDDSRCLKPMSVSMENTDASSGHGGKPYSRPVQRPPSDLYLSRDTPIDLSPTFLSAESCGRFTVGQKYWVDCNMCVCTPQGPKCTAKNCT